MRLILAFCLSLVASQAFGAIEFLTSIESYLSEIKVDGEGRYDYYSAGPWGLGPAFAATDIAFDRNGSSASAEVSKTFRSGSGLAEYGGRETFYESAFTGSAEISGPNATAKLVAAVVGIFRLTETTGVSIFSDFNGAPGGYFVLTDVTDLNNAFDLANGTTAAFNAELPAGEYNFDMRFTTTLTGVDPLSTNVSGRMFLAFDAADPNPAVPEASSVITWALLGLAVGGVYWKRRAA